MDDEVEAAELLERALDEAGGTFGPAQIGVRAAGGDDREPLCTQPLGDRGADPAGPARNESAAVQETRFSARAPHRSAVRTSSQLTTSHHALR